MPLDEKYFYLFIFAAGVIVLIMLLKIWRKAPPFRRSLPPQFTTYRQQLQLSAVNLKHWLVLPLLAWMLLFAHRLYGILGDISRMKLFPISATAGALHELSGCLLFALAVTLLAFVIHWHAGLRLARLCR